MSEGMDTGKTIFGAGGQWAAERFFRAASEGRQLSSGELRTLDTLRHEEWKYFDDAIIAEAMIQLHGVADLIGAGMTKNVPNALGHTILAYEKMTFMQPASVSLDGNTQTEDDGQEFQMANLPLPITHKDWSLNLRTLMASRERGEPLDTTQSRTAGRVVGEMAEQMLFQGSKVFGGMPIYGYMTAPNRNTASFGTNGSWAQAAKTGADFLADTLSMISKAQAKRMYGGYWLYVSRDASVNLDNDFKALGTLSVRQRLLQVEGIDKITTVDQLPTGNVILVQHTSDVVSWVQGEPLQTVQWDMNGGFRVRFKAWQIGVPLIRDDIQGRSGIVHMS